MDDLLILGLAAAVLAYASLLLYIRLSSAGIARTRIVRLLAELWGSFLLIIGAFSLASYLLGPVPQSSLAREFAARLSRIGMLSLWQQALLIGIFVFALVLFVHLLWSLRNTERDVSRFTPPPDGGFE